VDLFDTLSWLILLVGANVLLIDGLLEKLLVSVQTKLVHRVDLVEVVKNEEQSGCFLGA
jgi:hypothetical protein